MYIRKQKKNGRVCPSVVEGYITSEGLYDDPIARFQAVVNTENATAHRGDTTSAGEDRQKG